MRIFNKKSILSIMLVFIVAFSVFTLSAFAEDPLASGTNDVPQAEDVSVPETGDETGDEAAKMIFEPMRFVHTLKFMGVGMIGIFIVMGVIIVSVVVLNKTTSPRKETDDNE